ncbi:hypothetical protein [Metabacillus sp. Hm71]
MWVITTFFNKKMTMYEFDTEKEAKEAFGKIKGDKFLSEIVYFNDYGAV